MVEAGEPAPGHEEATMCSVRSGGGGPHEASTLGYMAGRPKIGEAAGIPDWLSR
jgi:hypothetical protein